MTKQLLIYEKAVPVSSNRHKSMSVQRMDYSYASDLNAVPIVIGEFGKIALEYPIVFTRVGERIEAVALLGFRDRENLYLNEDGTWDANYVPAFIRRYPFVFHHRDEAEQFVLCIDESYPGVNSEGLGQRLFDDAGEGSDYLKRMLDFTTSYQKEALMSQTFGDRLIALDILGQAEVTFTQENGAKAATRGMIAIDKERLAKLPAEKLAELMEFGDLERIYAHLISLANIDKLGTRLRRVVAAAAY